MKALQRLLTHSFSGKALAVKRVTENKGKRTPGVDGEIWNTPTKKAAAIGTLRRRGYRPQPLRRTYIPKNDGKRKRPLSIPVMKDRAMQALHLLALDPIAECKADPNSYAFRKERCQADAIEQCHTILSKKSSAEWVYEGDLKACFNDINHKILLQIIGRNIQDSSFLTLLAAMLNALDTWKTGRTTKRTQARHKAILLRLQHVAKNVIDFSIAISREQLRPNYGEGFKGAPLVTARTSSRVLDQTREVNHDEQETSNTEEVDGASQL